MRFARLRCNLDNNAITAHSLTAAFEVAQFAGT